MDASIHPSIIDKITTNKAITHNSYLSTLCDCNCPEGQFSKDPRREVIAISISISILREARFRLSLRISSGRDSRPCYGRRSHG